VIVKTVLKAFLLLIALGAILAATAFVWIGSRGITAKTHPGRIETAVARTMRRFAIPRAARRLQNPIEKSPETIAEGLAHYADHCAACHANDGSGETEIGRGLYPRPPDMRLPPTQSLSDGELFYIIENGIRLSGMPAWSSGPGEEPHATWHLVHFIRELPRLTPEQLEQMKGLNPRSPEEIRQEIEAGKLRGHPPDASPPRPAPHQHKHRH
jgi:mono/diheme cytochrome c family protein